MRGRGKEGERRGRRERERESGEERVREWLLGGGDGERELSIQPDDQHGNYNC